MIQLLHLFSNVVIFLIGVFIYYRYSHLRECTDICRHIEYILSFNQGILPINGHFIYFLVVSVFSFFSGDYEYVSITASIILSLCLVGKKWVTEYILSQLILSVSEKHSYILEVLVILISFLLALHSNVPIKIPFNAPWPPITWLNSTTIFVFPFCMYLFYVSFKALRNTSLSTQVFLQLIIISVFIIFTKPNYMLVFLITFPLFALFFQRKIIVQSILLSFVIVLILALQYYYIFFIYVKHYNFLNYQNIKITIEPFHAWNRISSNILASSVLWFALPVYVFIVYFKLLIKEKIYIYSIIQFFIAILIFILFEERTENGKIYGSVNFIWQAIITLYIWTIVSVAMAVKYYVTNLQNKKIIIHSIIIFALIIYYTIASVIPVFKYN